MKLLSLLAFTSLSLAYWLPLEANQRTALAELAFDMREFAYQERIAVSPDGKWIAYTVRQKPSDVDFNQDLPNGTPAYSVGCQIYISDREGQIAHLLSNGNCWSPTWSPDSKELAFYSDLAGRVQLWLFDLEAKAARVISQLPIKSTWTPLDAPSWSENGQKMIIPVANETQDENTPVHVEKQTGPTCYSTATVTTTEEQGTEFYIDRYCSTLVSIDCKTGIEKVVIPSTADPFPAFHRLSPSGKWLSYLSPIFKDETVYGYFDLAITKVDGSTAVNKLTTDLVTDQGFIAPCYQWHPEKDLLVYVKEQKIYLVEMDDEGQKLPKCLCLEPLDLFSIPLHYSQDGSYLIAGGKPKVHEQLPQTMFLISLSGDRIVEIPFGEKWEYIEIFEATPQQLWQPEKDSITLFLQEKETGVACAVRFSWDDENTVKEKVLWRCFGRIRHPVAIENDIFAIYEDVSTPPNIFRFNSDFSRKEKITTIDPRLDLFKPPQVEIFHTDCPLYDGTIKKLKTSIVFPHQAQSNEKFPAVVCFYPGSDQSFLGKDFMGGNNAVLHSLLLLERGYALIFPEVPLNPEGQPGQPLQEMTDALLPQVYHAIEKGYIDPDKIGLLGHSYGGYGTAGILSKTPLFRAAVASSGVYDLAGKYGDGDKDRNEFFQWWAEKGQGRMGSSPWQDLSRYLQNSPYYLADQIHTPLLLLQGEGDPLSKGGVESSKMFMALKRLGRPAELLLYPNEGHVPVMWSKPNAIDVSLRVLDFLDRHLKQNND